MEKRCFRSLDGLSATGLEFVFKDMLSRESSKNRTFNPDDYEWHIGEEVHYRIKCLSSIYVFEFDYKTHKFLGIDVIINTRDVKPRDICLVEKSKIGCNNCRFNDSCMYTHACRYTGEYLNWQPMTLGQKIGKAADHRRLVGDIDTGYHYVDTDIVSTINESKRRAQEMDIHRDYEESMLYNNIVKSIVNKNYEPIKAEEAGTMKIDYTTCHKRNLFAITKPEIEGVIFHGPCTIVKWSDGDKTIVRCKIEDFDKEKGLAMAICKKMMGTNKTKSNYYDIFKKWLPEEVTADNSTHITRSFDILTADEFAKLIDEPLLRVLTNCELGVYRGAKKVMGEWLIPYLKTSEV